MRVMVLVKATAPSEAGQMPSPERLAAMGAFNQKLIAAGVMQDGGGLKPSAQGARVAFVLRPGKSEPPLGSVKQKLANARPEATSGTIRA